jgi:superfamily I DNA/RNA helicase/CRISPR/Cas system-associated exonuclease Cas4 (RecB family)
MSREPNTEQKIAIDSSGGVILEAGAGSGKTFVIVKHLIKIIEDFLTENKNSLDFEKEIDKFLSSIVVMTFTKKAAGELKIRFKEELQGLASRPSAIDSERFNSCISKAGLIFIGTIDSFCRKISGLEGFPYLFRSSEVLDEIHLRKIIDRSINEWYKSQPNMDLVFEKFILLKKEQLVNSFFYILSDPIKRLSWTERKLNYNPLDIVYSLFSKYDFVLNLEIPKECYKSKTKWAEFVIDFKKLKLNSFGLAELERLQEFFEQIDRFPSYRGKEEELVAFFKGAKELRTLIKDELPTLSYINQNIDEYRKWQDSYQNFFKWMEISLDNYRGFNFADIEYQTLRALDDEEFQQSASKKFKYFIIDEFQDTSELQFNIVSKIVENNLKKLFLVGDVKQAIYGFRGGDVSLFVKSIEQMPSRLQLKTNYRSHQVIIDFNNRLFDLVNDKYSFSKLSFLAQKSVCDNEESGVIELVNSEKEKNEKLRLNDLDKEEASLISNYVQESLDVLSETTILYRNLKPSFYLMTFLEKKKISFKAQFKMSLKDCPVFGMFWMLCKKYKIKGGTEAESRAIDYILKSYFSILIGDSEFEEFISKAEEWYSDCDYLGFYYSFIKLFKNLGVFSDKFQGSLEKIKIICKVTGNNIDQILLLLNKTSSESIKYEYQSGPNPKINIMTVHASKGLEFDTVIVAGIYSNSARANRLMVLGSTPENFMWQDKNEELRLSLGHILEKYAEDRRDISEELRLMYVAFTRAKRKLMFCNLDGDFKVQNNSWIDVLRNINFSSLLTRSIEVRSSMEDSSSLRKPLFHEDPEIKIWKNRHVSDFTFLPELAVTSLVTWVKCPELFYFKFIYKLDDDLFRKPKTVEKDLPDIEIKGSGSSRGISFHRKLEECAREKNFDLYPELKWIGDKLGNFYHSHQVIPELELKFESGGQVISGTPDLIIMPFGSKGLIRIWDYKTGMDHPSVKESYYYQLYFYAIGVAKVFSLDTHSLSFELSLVYIDLNRFESLTLTFLEIEIKIKEFWSTFMLNPTRNPDHCSLCNYNNICLSDL